MKIGKDAVVMGDIPLNDAQIGDGSVVIGPMDSHGNIIINQPMAVGHGAQAGPNCIAIGAFASAGLAQTLRDDLQQLCELAAKQNNNALEQELEKLKSELSSNTPNKNAIITAWEAVKALANIDGAHNLLAKITTGLNHLLTIF